MSRLTIEIDADQHRKIKTLATFAGMTIKDYILEKTLSPSVPVKQEGDTTTKLLSSPKNAARLRKAISSATPKHLIFKNEKELKDALGI